MDAVKLAGETIKRTAEITPEGFGCAKIVVFCNAVEDNPFMAGAFHGSGEADAVINVGVSGPGVVKAALENSDAVSLTEVAEVVKKTAFKITRVGELIGREASKILGIPFGILDLSLAPTPAVGDSVARILEEMGLSVCGTHGTTAALALLNDAVKKGGMMASSAVGGLSGAFIPVSEDEGMIAAAEAGVLTLDKLEAMTAVCSVGLDMIAVPGDTPAHTISGIIADEAAIGMAHRGRLNVLTNIAGKTYGQVFREFEGTVDASTVQGSGDVKYHLGTEGSFTSESGNTTKIYLAANPSHLEAVDPVLEGIVRAKQDIIDRGPDGFTVLPILVHGDAAMIGQGVVAETLNLSQLRGYRTGGTIHVVVNNQVGFTTPPSSSRSSVYPTDFAKAIQAPIFHVNGDDPEAVVHVGRLAFEYREKFNRDVVIDLVCYRRRGHNEGDDPSMTQPLMYNLIDGKRSTRKLYTEALVGRGDLTQEEADGALKEYQSLLEAAFSETHKAQTTPMPAVGANGALGMPKAQAEDADVSDPRADNTAITPEFIKAVGDAHTEIPEGFHIHPKLKTLLERRADMSVNGGIDWGFAELTAFASLTSEGIPVRITGQDSRRGTFVQRHAVFHDRTNDDEWTPLHQVKENAAKFMIHDSSLSEYAVLGFEYGYSVERTDALVLWEAQFGDFVNGAQTIIDEFVSSGEQKWGQRSSVVMLLPHGYEGQGPDHSSARIERFLQLCAEDNMRVINPTTGANYFHALRRQAYLRPRKPMVVFTPKQLLRLKAAAQPIEAFTQQTFQPVIPDNDVDASKVKRVMLVSGRLYYDLLARRKKDKDETTAIVRVEQLYPLPQEQIAAELAKYPNADIRWVQDEPENQGPWPFMAINLVPTLDREVTVVSRPAAAAPSTGSSKVHAQENADLLDRAFN